jgi:hypothetical protein
MGVVISHQWHLPCSSWMGDNVRETEESELCVRMLGRVVHELAHKLAH